ncbi:MAG: Calx-beta domain-containing protein, partial [Pseudomonadota bacterium]
MVRWFFFSFKQIRGDFLLWSTLAIFFLTTGCGVDVSLDQDASDSEISQKRTMTPPSSVMNLEESNNGVLLLVFSEPLAVAAQIQWEIAGGAGDFSATQGYSNVEAGESSFAIQIDTIDDGVPETAKNFNLRIWDAGISVDNEVVVQIFLNDNDVDIGSFNIEGVQGGSDTTSDGILESGLIPHITWQDASLETSYSVTIYQTDFSTVHCASQTVGQDMTNFSFSGCPLVQGKEYRVGLEASNGVNSLFASNNGFLIYVPPTLSLADNTVVESAGTAQIVASLSAVSDRDVTFNFGTVDGTAVSSGSFKDFDAVASQSVTISAGSLSVNLDVDIDDDARDEPDQVFDVIASGLTEVLALDLTAQMTITDNDLPPSLRVAANAVKVIEGSALDYTVTLSEISEYTVQFDWATSSGNATDGIDYSAVAVTTESVSPGTVSLPLSVVGLDDAVTCESDQDVDVNLTSPVNATITTSSASITMVGNDRPILTFTDPTATEGTTLAFNGTLSFACSSDVSVDVFTVDSSAEAPMDYTTVSTSSTILAGATVLNINVSTIDDSHGEMPTEKMILGFHSERIATDETSFGIGSIQDNDVNNDQTVALLAGHRSFSCALTGNGRARCWGEKFRTGVGGA